MTLFEVVLKATRDGYFHDMTRRFPSVKMFIWCNKDHDVIEVIVKNEEDYPLVMQQMRECDILAIVEESSDDQKLYLMVHECHCMKQDTMARHIGTLDLLHVFPVILEKGWEYHRVIAFRHEDFKELLHRLENSGWILKILRKAPFNGFIASSLTLTADALFSALTDKQTNALLTAHKNGYYMLPRKADVQTIAAKERVPRTTFQEHLKKAENKLLGALVPYMQLFHYAPIGKRKSLRIT